MNDHETLAVVFAYVALALVGPFMLTRLAQWLATDDAANLASEIGAALERQSAP